MNLAFQDAEALAYRLTYADNNQSFDEACEAYASIRYGQVRRVFRRTHLGGRVANLTHPAGIKARRALLRALNHITP